MANESLITTPLQPVTHDKEGRILDAEGKTLNGIVLNMDGTYDRVKDGQSTGTFSRDPADTSFKGAYTLTATDTDDQQL